MRCVFSAPPRRHSRSDCSPQYLSRLAAVREASVYPAWRPSTSPSVYPAWRPSTSPVFVPLGDCPRGPYLSRLATVHEARIYPAWRLSTRPVFIPLGTRPIQNFARKNPFPRLRGKVAAGRKGEYKTSIYPAWQPPARPVFIPLGGRQSCTKKPLGKGLYGVVIRR